MLERARAEGDGDPLPVFEPLELLE
jgi:hypothetical protein